MERINATGIHPWAKHEYIFSELPAAKEMERVRRLLMREAKESRMPQSQDVFDSRISHAHAAGTLGRFTTEYYGRITAIPSKYEFGEPTWSFEGRMRFYDVYDFVDSDQKLSWLLVPADLLHIEGKPFVISSPWIPI